MKRSFLLVAEAASQGISMFYPEESLHKESVCSSLCAAILFMYGLYCHRQNDGKCKVSVKLRNKNRGIIMLQDEGNLELDTYLMLKGIVKKETETGLIMK